MRKTLDPPAASPRELGLWAEGKALLSASEALETAGLSLTFERPTPGQEGGADAIVEVVWRGSRQRYACEIKATATPKSILAAAGQAAMAARILGLQPLIVVPYLSEERLQELARLGVSGIDFSGNASLLAESFQFWRSGQPAQSKGPSPALNPFRGDNSIFSRCFLLREEFESLSELREFAVDRLPPMGEGSGREVLRLGTASKTVKALEEQLIVHKAKGKLKLVDRGRLLSQLKTNYRPINGQEVRGRIPAGPEEAWKKLSGTPGVLAAATGLGSAIRHGVLSPSDTLSLYVEDLGQAISLLGFREARSFVNCRLVETSRPLAFFDSWPDGSARWASEIQTWLELSHGDAREQEAGLELERRLREGGGRLG